jgi:hypothetical protein
LSNAIAKIPGFVNIGAGKTIDGPYWKIMSSIVICVVRKSRTMPKPFMVLQPRMRSYTGLVILC